MPMRLRIKLRNLLIYYTGHGDIKNNNAYWIGTDSKKKISSDWLNVKDVDAAIGLIKAKDLLLMVDACYFGIRFKSNNSSDKKIIGPTEEQMNDEKYFNKVLNRRSRLVMTSGNQEPVVDSLIDGHSPFAFIFLDILRNNTTYETTQSMFVKIAKYHAELSQNPSLYASVKWGHLGGDFVFVKKN